VVPGLGRLGTAWFAVEQMQVELKRMETALAEEKRRAKRDSAGVESEIDRLRRWLSEHEKMLPDQLVTRMRGGGLVDRREAAAILHVSVRTVQRMEKKGMLVRCPNTGTAVRYLASDVLKLASARPWKED
jgi:hypothetical protein